MKHINDQFQHLEYWFSRGLGKAVLDAEVVGVANYLRSIFGYHLLQLGGPRNGDLLAGSPITDQIYLHPELTSEIHSSSVRAKFTELPFLPNSIDLVFLPHLLEYQKRPYKVLSEVYHILIPDGQVLIVGFNPVSLWGITKLFSQSSSMPWCGKFMGIAKMQHCLRDIGFTIVDYQTFFYRPPVTHNKTRNRLLFMEAIGQLLWPFGGAVYIMLAKKSVLGVIPLRKKSVQRRKVTVGASYVKPTTRSFNEKN